MYCATITSIETIGDPEDVPIVVEVELIDDVAWLKNAGFDKPDLTVFLIQPNRDRDRDMVIVYGEDIEALVEALTKARDQYREALVAYEVFS